MKKINEEILTEEFWLCDTEEELLEEISEFLYEDSNRVMQNIDFRFEAETGHEATLYYNIYR